jgi:cyclopropane fatty-acyl-phospholipid synthase-like methyltransferase
MGTSEFYDHFISYQIKTGINDRIYGLYKRLLKVGLPSDSNVLEIGCGIGSLTSLLARKIKKGTITSLDISEKSIQYARSHITRTNITFHFADIMEFQADLTFNRILLFDVIEHIPEEQHVDLFSKISGLMNEDALLFINMPNPYHILFDQKHKPEALQEIDQPIFINNLVNVMAKVSLDMIYFETYSIWVKDDYHYFIVKKRSEFTEHFVHNDRTVFQKIVARLHREMRKFIYLRTP